MNDLHGLLFAYRADANLGELTRPRNTCSLPFGGRYRLIDFMLSNYVNAGISDVGIIVHQNYQSLLDHLGSGKDWDLSRKHGGLRILPPFSYARRGGDPMDALAGVSDYLNNIRQDYVILGRGDVALNLPVADVFQQHLDSGADVTVVCTPTLRGAPRSSEYVEVSESGRITDLSIHPIAAGDQLESGAVRSVQAAAAEHGGLLRRPRCHGLQPGRSPAPPGLSQAHPLCPQGLCGPLPVGG